MRGLCQAPRVAAWLVTGLLFSSGTAAAQGANLDLTVFPQAVSGQAPPTRAGFLVCVGTSSDLDQYGTETTPTGGVANQNFRNLPVGTQVVVTVQKAGYTGKQLATTLRVGWDNHLQAPMYAGSGGPSCPSAATSAPPAVVPPPPVPVAVSGTAMVSLDAFLSLGASENLRRVALNVAVPVTVSFLGITPTHIRYSERADLSDAGWQPAGQQYYYTFKNTGQRTLYMQGKAGTGTTARHTVVASNRVEVVGFSTSGVQPPLIGKAGTESKRLECGNGTFVTSLIGRRGLWIDAIGIRCAGNVTHGPFGGSGGEAFTIWDVSECPTGGWPGTLSMDYLKLRVPIVGTTFYENQDVLRYFRISGCHIVPAYGAKPRRAIAATGAECPLNSIPTAVDVHVAQKPITGHRYVSGVGLVCVAPGT